MGKNEISLNEVDRIVYIWARYSGTYEGKKEKTYYKGELQDLIERLQRYKENPESFSEGFEKEDEEED